MDGQMKGQTDGKLACILPSSFFLKLTSFPFSPPFNAAMQLCRLMESWVSNFWINDYKSMWICSRKTFAHKTSIVKQKLLDNDISRLHMDNIHLFSTAT